jgi:hypothetical protein
MRRPRSSSLYVSASWSAETFVSQFGPMMGLGFSLSVCVAVLFPDLKVLISLSLEALYLCDLIFSAW